MIRRAASSSSVAPSPLAETPVSQVPSRDGTDHAVQDPRQRSVVGNLVDTLSDAIRPAKLVSDEIALSNPGLVTDTKSSSGATSTGTLSPMGVTSNRHGRVIGARESSVRQACTIRILEDDVVAQTFSHLPPIELVETGPNLVDKLPPSNTRPVFASIGLIFLLTALAIASSPLFDASIDVELLVHNNGMLVKKNATYAKAYFLGNGFYADFVMNMKSNITGAVWFPQPTDSTFLNCSYMLPSEYSAYGSDACALLNPDPKNPVECIMMTGHLGSVSSYGVCRNGSEFIALQYVAGLVTPADVGGLVSAGMWVENTREVIFTGLKKPPMCVDGKMIVISPDLHDWRLTSGPFAPSLRGDTNQWLDAMDLPAPLRQRMFCINSKGGGRLGITVPNSRRQSFDGVISESVFGSTLADTLEIQAPFSWEQSLGLLTFLLALTIRNSPTRSYLFVAQILRLPTFCIISLQLLYVLYYQILSIVYLSANPTLQHIFIKKVVYAVGVCFILMHQVDVRSAVSLWPCMANTDSYYVARLTWMVGSLSLITFFTQHWICLAILCGHPIANGIIRIFQRYTRNRSEHRSRDRRHPDYVTSVEAYGCGGPLTRHYSYHMLVTREIHRPNVHENANCRTLQYLTCDKAVRDEGFVMLGGCSALVRAKDVYVFLLMKFVPRGVAAYVNLSVAIAHVADFRLTPLRRISYEALWSVSRRWDGGLSYLDIG